MLSNVIGALKELQAARNGLARQRQALAELGNKPENPDQVEAWETEAKALVEAVKTAEAELVDATSTAEREVKISCAKPTALTEEDLGLLATAARQFPAVKRFVRFAERHASPERWAEWKAWRKHRRHVQRQNRKRGRLTAIAKQCERGEHPNKHNKRQDTGE